MNPKARLRFARIQLKQIAVSDRGSLKGLTQFSAWRVSRGEPTLRSFSTVLSGTSAVRRNARRLTGRASRTVAGRHTTRYLWNQHAEGRLGLSRPSPANATWVLESDRAEARSGNHRRVVNVQRLRGRQPRGERAMHNVRAPRPRRRRLPSDLRHVRMLCTSGRSRFARTCSDA